MDLKAEDFPWMWQSWNLKTIITGKEKTTSLFRGKSTFLQQLNHPGIKKRLKFYAPTKSWLSLLYIYYKLE